MAATRPPGPHLSGAVAVLAGGMLASATPTGPWQPAAAILGWAGFAILTVTLVTGHTWGLGAAIALFAGDVAVESVAGEEIGSSILAAGTLFLVVEAGGISFESRRRPVLAARDLARGAALAATAALVVAGAALMVGLVTVVGPAVPIVGLLAAATATGLLLWLGYRPESPP